MPPIRSVAPSIDFTKVCFIIMPFGTKPVGKHKVNFDRIYDEIFKPAVRAVELPEGGKLEPRRTDKDFFASDITQDMFEYLEHSRIAMADMTGLNANVMYEIGIRHHARANGLAIFRQTSSPIPFDVNHIKAFPYDYRPAKNATEARALIRRVLRESLVHNRLDSPVQIALRAMRQTQEATPTLEPLLREAENHIRDRDQPAAIATLRRALREAGGNAIVHMRLGLLLRDQGLAEEALDEFQKAIALQPKYSDAWREKGIIEGRLKRATAEASIRKAIELNPDDFDALASLGGLLRKAGRFPEALELYDRSAQVSGGHPYPLLMALKLRARTTGKLDITGTLRKQLVVAERMREAQAEATPPLDSPWCFFDLAEIRLYSDDPAEFLEWAKKGLKRCKERWQPETFRSALQLLVDGGVKLDGLDKGIAAADAAIAKLP